MEQRLLSMEKRLKWMVMIITIMITIMITITITDN